MKIPLLDGAYTTKSVIASAQRQANLLSEENPPDSPFPVTLYPTPGLTLLGSPPIRDTGRGLYRTSQGQLIYVCGSRVYSIANNWTFTQIGSITSTLGPVSMSDNGTTAVLVDGTTKGYKITLSTLAFSTITDPAFYGSNLASVMDTYLLFSRPTYPTFYISNSNDVAFNPLYFADKSGFPDPLQGVVAMSRQAWLIGTLTSEIWINSGAADFPFQIASGVFLEQGCVAPYSIAKQDLALYWVSQDLQGQGIIIRGAGYLAQRISTHAIEQELATYPTLSDAIGFTYQINGHTFYQVTFPTADKTWMYDEASKRWTELFWIDNEGIEHRHRANGYAFCYQTNVVCDWENGNLYNYDQNNYTDNGDPRLFIRGFPHIINDGKRVFHTQFIADMEVGTENDSTVHFDGTALRKTETNDLRVTEQGWIRIVKGPQFGPPIPNEPQVSLRYSDTKGASWRQRRIQGMGAGGNYYRQIQFQRLGMARDRVYELSWSAPVKTALNGAFLSIQGAGS